MMKLNYDNQIDRWLTEHREEILADLMALMRIPSVRGKSQTGAPYGKECQRALEASVALFERYGFDSRTEAERGYALSFEGLSDKTIALMAHADVVPVEEDWIHTAPFTPLIRNGVLIGRGGADDKAGILAALSVMRMVRELNLPVRSRLLAFVGINEETGMADIQSFAANEPIPDLSLIADGEFPCSLGEKSKLGVWVESGTAFTAIRNFSGGVSSTVVLGTVEVELKADATLAAELRARIKGDSRFILSEDGARLQAFGLPAHAAMNPEEGINAAVLAADLLCSCPSLPESDKSILKTVSDYLTDPFGSGTRVDHIDKRFGRLTCASGLAEVKEGRLRLNLDLRYGTELSSEILKKRLQTAWGKRGWRMEVITCREGCHVADDSPFPASICDTYRFLTGDDAPAFYMAGGTYAHYLPNAFSLGVCAETGAPKIPLPEGHGGVHQSDEALDIDGFFLAIRILTNIVLQCDEQL